jgi:MinD-like ATPase involved in chromosome partitioning or flagellar assembly
LARGGVVDDFRTPASRKGDVCPWPESISPTLPFVLRASVAVVVAAIAALLGWGRYAGRPLLTWAWLALRFAVAPQSGGGDPVGAPPAAVPETRAALRDAAGVATLAPSTPQHAPPSEPSATAATAPAADAVPPWARWLDFDTSAPAEPPARPLPPDTVETSRDVPLVVVMDHANQQPDAPTEEDAESADDCAEAKALEREAAAGATAVVPQDGGPQPPGNEPPQPSPRSDDPPLRPEPAAVLHLPLARPGAARQPEAQLPSEASPPPVFVGAPRRITFFSLNGGSGRTTLATEVACVLAARGRHLATDGTARPLHVALLDLDMRSATVAVRLGIAQPTLSDYIARGGDPTHLEACMVRHPTGLRALLGPPKPVASGPTAMEPARVAEVVHRLERDGAQFIVIDVGADLGAVTTWVLSAVHDIYIVITPTASGVQDAYRTTEALRRLGLAHKLRYVVNRARTVPDLSEVMGDLGGRVTATIPYDAAIEDAENNHRIAALDGGSSAANALHDLAASIYPALSATPRRTRLPWLPWRRRAG